MPLRFVGPVLASALLAFQLGCSQLTGSMPLPQTFSVERAVMRGGRAPDLNGLYRAIVAHLLAQPQRPPRLPPQKVCVLVPLDPVRHVVHIPPDPSVLDGLLPPESQVQDGSGCTGQPDGSALLVAIDSIERWWDTPDEYEVHGTFIIDTSDEMDHEHDGFDLVAVHRRDGWVIVR